MWGGRACTRSPAMLGRATFRSHQSSGTVPFGGPIPELGRGGSVQKLLKSRCYSVMVL